MIAVLQQVQDVDLIAKLERVKYKMESGEYPLYHSEPFTPYTIPSIPEGSIPDYAECTSHLDQYNVSIEETGYMTWFIRENYNRHCTVSGEFLYRPNGIQSWHTNANLLGWRYYFVYNEGSGSTFHYRNHHGHYCSEIEPEKLWVMRAFQISEDGYNEHAVAAGDSNRISIGFREV